MSNHRSFDPSMNILHRGGHQLDAIFNPKVIAVVGATETLGSVGRTLMANLLSASKDKKIYPINPKRDEVLNVKAYPTLASVPEKVDLVVVVTPAKIVPSIIEQAANLSIPAAIIISAGFKEMGEPGLELERQILFHARRGKMRIIGPNCLGVMNPNSGLNATFAAGLAHRGNIAFISQSGALCTAVLDWSLKEKVGFSAFVSIGSMVDVNFGDLISYLGNDPMTKSILIYMENVGDARAFLSSAREVSLTKPIILIKAGRTKESAQAAASHTGAMAGSDEALTAALKRVGVIRVDTIAELFAMAETLAKQPRPKGPNLMIVTNAGGPGVIATDALVSNNASLSTLSQSTLDELNAILPAPWSHNNPVDVLGDASAEIYAKTIEIISKDPHADAVLVILTPQDMTDPTETAKKLTNFAKLEKPLLASWMGGKSVQEGVKILTDAGIPQFEFPDMACKTFANMWQYSYNLKGIYETPVNVSSAEDYLDKNKKIDALIQKVRKEHRTILDEVESKEILEAYDIPVVPTKVAKTCDDAVLLSEKFGYPVVLKLYSKTITHKSDVGGVKLNLQTKDAVVKSFKDIQNAVKKEDFNGVTVQPMIKLDGYELIIGSSLDQDFGPVMLFGSGGQLVEVYKDRALAIPPLTTTLAKRMMEQTKVYEALHGVRGKKKIDFQKLEQILVRFSNLIVCHPWIKECDINPLLVSSEKMVALDARVILHDPDTKQLPQSAIRPYPLQYVEKWKLKDQSEVFIRPIRPEDEHMMFQFHKDLSKETVRHRYLKSMNYEERIERDRLIKICFTDYDREIALIVEKKSEMLGVIRLSKISGTKDARFALVVKDQYQHQGIGSKLMQKMIEVAKHEKIEKIYAYLLKENFQMQKLLHRYGFSLKPIDEYFFAEKEV